MDSKDRCVFRQSGRVADRVGGRDRGHGSGEIQDGGKPGMGMGWDGIRGNGCLRCLTYSEPIYHPNIAFGATALSRDIRTFTTLPDRRLKKELQSNPTQPKPSHTMSHLRPMNLKHFFPSETTTPKPKNPDRIRRRMALLRPGATRAATAH